MCGPVLGRKRKKKTEMKTPTKTKPVIIYPNNTIIEKFNAVYDAIRAQLERSYTGQNKRKC